MNKNEWHKINPSESGRTYLFPNGSQFTVYGVVALKVSDSGTHYLESSDGKKHIVSPGWIAISIDVQEWSI